MHKRLGNCKVHTCMLLKYLHSKLPLSFEGGLTPLRSGSIQKYGAWCGILVTRPEDSLSLKLYIAHVVVYILAG